jgi:hypothetical protein
LNNKNFDIIFLGLGKNIEKTILTFLNFIGNLSKNTQYKKIIFIVGENDSKDKTRNILKNFNQSYFKIKLIDTSKISKIKNRILRLAHGREMLKEFIIKNNLKSKFVSVVDLDDVIDSNIDIKNFCDALDILKKNSNSLFAISSKSHPYYYDILNLIIPNYYETDVFKELTYNFLRMYDVRKKNIYEPQKKITKMRDVDTISSHNGLCVYIYENYVSSSYIKKKLNNLDETIIEPEHISFNKKIHNSTGKFIRMTNLINLKTPEEHMPIKSLISFFWIKLNLYLKKISI